MLEEYMLEIFSDKFGKVFKVFLILKKPVEPIKPYIKVIPKSKIPEDKPPKQKYFTAASIEACDVKLRAARTYKIKLKPSKDKKAETKFDEDTKKIINDREKLRNVGISKLSFFV